MKYCLIAGYFVTLIGTLAWGAPELKIGAIGLALIIAGIGARA